MQPLEGFGFFLNKGEFRYALRRLWYVKELRDSPPSVFVASRVYHALNCNWGGFAIIRHNNIRDFEANLIRQGHSVIAVETHSEPANEDHINGLTGDDARSNIRAKSVWRN